MLNDMKNLKKESDEELEKVAGGTEIKKTNEPLKITKIIYDDNDAILEGFHFMNELMGEPNIKGTKGYNDIYTGG